MPHTRTHPFLRLLALAILLTPLALARPAAGSLPAGRGARLSPEEAIAAALDGSEVGANDFRLSDMGQDNTYDAYRPAVAYNSTEDEYLVVWHGDDDTLADGEYEIYGQRVDATTGDNIGAAIRLSDMGPDGDPAYDAFSPDVAYNDTADEYLVVWHGDDNTAPFVDEELEIYAQRVEGHTGSEIGPDLRLSDMGPNGDASYDARSPAVVYNSAEDEYLVVWYGDDNAAPLVEGEYEIFGQLVDATGGQVGTNDLRISAMGPDGDPSYEATLPDVACNSTDNTYLVVWMGDDNTGALVATELEIYGQRVSALGNPIGDDDFRLSDMGPDGDPGYDAGFPAVAYSPVQNEYLVVWTGDDDTLQLVDDEFEIYGQRVDAAAGDEIGVDTRLSDMGVDGSTAYAAEEPAVAYNAAAGEYLVVWYGDDNSAPLVDGEFEVYGQRVDAASGAAVGTNDFRLSDMGPEGDPDYDANYPAVAGNSSGNQYLVTWEGDDDTPPLVDQEFEVHGQWVDGSSGAELGADRRLSDAGPGENAGYQAWFDPAVAYNPVNNEYLVVWTGSDNAPPLTQPEMEIYGQRVDAATGAEVGANDLRLSTMGPDGDTSYVAAYPAVAYNSLANEYLVVWMGSDDLAGLAPGEFEIYVQRLDAATGAEVGANDLRISAMGPDGDTDYAAYHPAVAYSPHENRYLVVWSGDDDTAPLVDGEEEVFGQVLLPDGGQVGPNDFRISDMGPDGDAGYDALMPDVAYNGADLEFLVVWMGDDDAPPLVDEEREVFGRRIEAATGLLIGPDRRLSDMGPDGDTSYTAGRPAVAWNSDANEYLVVWHGDDDTPPLVDEEMEVYGQRLDGATADEIGTNDIRLSAMGPDGDPTWAGGYPAVSYSSAGGAYLVVWYGDAPPLADGEFEIYGRRVDAASGTPLGDSFRLSDMGPDGDTHYMGMFPALAHNSQDLEYLVVWMGDDDTPPLVDDEHEVFGQRYQETYAAYLPLVFRSGGTP